MNEVTLSGLEKVALLLQSLPGELVGKVMRHMGPKHAEMIAAELEKLKRDPDRGEKLSLVIEEAATILAPAPVTKIDSTPPPQPESAPKTAPSQVDIRVEDKTDVKPMPDPRTEPLLALAAYPAELLAQALESESARTIVMLVNCLDIQVAGDLYKRLSAAKRKEVSLRFTEQPIVNEELVKRIAQGVVKKCQTIRSSSTSASPESGGREKRIATLLRGLERTERAEMISLLEKSDAELTGRVKALLYDFEDILRMENPSVQKLLSEIDIKSLAQALCGASANIDAKILGNLSKRAQGSLKEETDLNGSVPAAKVRQARQTIAQAIQRLDERGDLAFIES